MNTGGEINIVEAKAGEKFITLDGLEFETVGGEVVFKNGQDEIIDLPSIKGTANTSVDDSTKNILLLLESIKAEKVRFASMTHAIRTNAAQLMEKNVDPNLAEKVLLKGIQLYQELCDAKVASDIFDEFPGKKEPQVVGTPVSTIDNYLGVSLGEEKIKTILEQLECRVETKDSILLVMPPTFRPDLKIPADIVEEIARIYGYHNLPNKLMDTPIPTSKQTGVDFIIEEKVKRFLANVGLQEVYTYSMISEGLALETDSLENHLKLANPLTDDRVYLRKSLIPSLNEILDQNSFETDLSVFELSNVYLPQTHDQVTTALPKEALKLTIVSTLRYRTVRGIVESLLAQFYVPQMTVNQTGESSGTIMTMNQNLGEVQVLPSNRVAIELDFAVFLKVARTHPTYQPIPKTAILMEDMTFTLTERTPVGKILDEINDVSDQIISVELKDQYQQNYTFSLTYHDPKNNLSTMDIEPIRREVASRLREKYQAELVGEV
jgi:phenylalanyl-tRNA synthetase beta chain